MLSLCHLAAVRTDGAAGFNAVFIPRWCCAEKKERLAPHGLLSDAPHSTRIAARASISRLANSPTSQLRRGHVLFQLLCCACVRLVFRVCILLIATLRNNGFPQIGRGFDSERSSIWILLWRPSRYRSVHLDSAQRHEAGRTTTCIRSGDADLV